MIEKYKKLFIQLIRFFGVGVLCFIIDFAVLHILVEYAGMYYLLSAAIAFTVSVIVNYVLSIIFVFDVDKEKDWKGNFILFILFSVIGLGLTELLMWLGVERMHFGYMLVKVGATGIVMIFNFVTRKMFLER